VDILEPRQSQRKTLTTEPTESTERSSGKDLTSPSCPSATT
jgi:hypothetical protein